ncbi:MAG: hypothetical protein ACRDGS_12010 [Chloroflexota bacterium]
MTGLPSRVGAPSGLRSRAGSAVPTASGPRSSSAASVEIAPLSATGIASLRSRIASAGLTASARALIGLPSAGAPPRARVNSGSDGPTAIGPRSTAAGRRLIGPPSTAAGAMGSGRPLAATAPVVTARPSAALGPLGIAPRMAIGIVRHSAALGLAATVQPTAEAGPAIRVGAPSRAAPRERLSRGRVGPWEPAPGWAAHQ